MNNLRFWLLSLIAVLASGSVAAAQKPEKLGDFTAWQAFRMVEPSGQVVCWMLTDPQSRSPVICAAATHGCWSPTVRGRKPM